MKITVQSPARHALLIAGLGLLPVLPSCASCEPLDPPTIADYESMIYQVTNDLLEQERPNVGGVDISVAVLRIEYLGALDGYQVDGELYGAISQAITDSRLFIPISRSFVRAALREARIGDDTRLSMAEPRQAFLSVLEKEAQLPEYLIKPSLTTLMEGPNDCRTGRRSTLRLQMYRANTGELSSEASGSSRQSVEDQ